MGQSGYFFFKMRFSSKFASKTLKMFFLRSLDPEDGFYPP